LKIRHNALRESTLPQAASRALPQGKRTRMMPLAQQHGKIQWVMVEKVSRPIPLQQSLQSYNCCRTDETFRGFARCPGKNIAAV